MANEPNGANGNGQPTLPQLETRLDELWGKHSQAVEKRDLKAVTAVVTEMKRVEKSIEDFQTNAEKASRDALLPRIAEAMSRFEMPANLQLSGTAKRAEDGKFTDLTILLDTTDRTTLYDAFVKVFPAKDVEDLGSIKGIKFVIAGGEAEVEYTGTRAAGTSSGGGGGKGWQKDGTVLKMAEVFEQNASDEEKSDYEALRGEGSKQYQLKVKVAKAAGYTLVD